MLGNGVMSSVLVLYDSGCVLCDRTVRILLRADRSGLLFRFAPLGGPTFQRAVPAGTVREGLPDSIAVIPEPGRILVRSDALICVFRHLGGCWRFVAALLSAIPRPARDFAYDVVARCRYRLFGRLGSSCPVIPAEWSSRFDP